MCSVPGSSRGSPVLVSGESSEVIGANTHAPGCSVVDQRRGGGDYTRASSAAARLVSASCLAAGSSANALRCLPGTVQASQLSEELVSSNDLLGNVNTISLSWSSSVRVKMPTTSGASPEWICRCGNNVTEGVLTFRGRKTFGMTAASFVATHLR